MSTDSTDQEMMARAYRLARRGLFTTDPNPRVGCVIVRDGHVVGEGWHAFAGGPHAEVEALARCGEAARGATAYVTLEPCVHHGRTPPCTDALIEAGVARVVVGAADPNPQVAGQGIAALLAAGIEVHEGVLADVCHDLNRGFDRRMKTGRPFVTSKIAASIDGRTGLANGISQWISGESSRAEVQRMRARSTAVMTGIGTILADNPSLNVRDPGLGDVLQPLRIILDSSLRTPADSKLLTLAGETIVYCLRAEAHRLAALEASGAAVEVLPAVDGQLDLSAVLERLGDRGVNELLVEAGPALNGALLRAGLIDEYVVFVAPHVLGGDAQPMFDSLGLTEMSARHAFELADIRRFGTDCRMIWRRKN